MARAQNARRGFLQKQTLTVGTATITTGTITTATITTLTPTTLDIGGVMSLTANSTGIKTADYEADLPGNVDNGLLWGFISNSTGFCMFINSSGTTHKYLQVTTKQPA